MSHNPASFESPNARLGIKNMSSQADSSPAASLSGVESGLLCGDLRSEILFNLVDAEIDFGPDHISTGIAAPQIAIGLAKR